MRCSHFSSRRGKNQGPADRFSLAAAAKDSLLTNFKMPEAHFLGRDCSPKYRKKRERRTKPDNINWGTWDFSTVM